MTLSLHQEPSYVRRRTEQASVIPPARRSSTRGARDKFVVHRPVGRFAAESVPGELAVVVTRTGDQQVEVIGKPAQVFAGRRVVVGMIHLEPAETFVAQRRDLLVVEQYATPA